MAFAAAPYPTKVGGGCALPPPPGGDPPGGISSAGALPTPTHKPVGKRFPLPHSTAGKPLGGRAWRSDEQLTPSQGWRIQPSNPQSCGEAYSSTPSAGGEG